jgi:arylsulfatase A-like enzyme
MDWIAGEILNSIDASGIKNNTLVIFTSDNGPWVAEQACSGSKGPFEGQWFKENSDESCTACPHDYVPAPTETSPRRCILQGTQFELIGVPCGEDTGLGSVWEANLRMPALARLPGRIPANKSSDAVVSTLDVIPTFLSMIRKPVPVDLDGLDMSNTWTGKDDPTELKARFLFFWRDGFREGPLPPPAGRFDVAAVKLDNLKAWFWTKSAHYNDDLEVFHDPPLLFDTLKDPAESRPLDPSGYESEIDQIRAAVQRHKEVVGWTYPLALDRDPAYLPCADKKTGCRTHKDDGIVANFLDNSIASR